MQVDKPTLDKIRSGSSSDQQHEHTPEHDDHPNQELRVAYGPAGFRGLFSSGFVFSCAAFAALGGLLFGYDQGVISVILVMPQFIDRYTLVSPSAPGAGFYKGLMTALLELGAMIGALNMGWVADKYSRKYAIVIAVIIFTIGSIIQTAAPDYAALTVGRLIGGGGIGMLSGIAPLFISEISPPEIRGALLVLEEFAIVFGVVVAYWITYGTRFIPSEWSYRLPFLLQMVPSVFLGVGIFCVPFSPRWLAMKGRDEEALRTLARLRRLPTDDSRVVREWLDIRADVHFQQEVSRERHPHLHAVRNTTNTLKLELASWADCFKRGCWKRTMVGLGLTFFQQFVGINALIYYAPTLFETMGQDYPMQLLLAGVLNVAQLVGVATTLWSMDALGRRPLLLCGSLLMFISHFIIAVLVGRFDDNWPAHRTQGWVSVAFLFVFMVSFGATWGSVVWAMPAEIFPSSLRAKGVSLSTVNLWFWNFVIGLITPPLVQNTGFGAYTFFAVFCAASGVWTYFWVPETKGKGLEDMDQVFKDVSSEEEESRKRRIRGELRAQMSERGPTD